MKNKLIVLILVLIIIISSFSMVFAYDAAEFTGSYVELGINTNAQSIVNQFMVKYAAYNIIVYLDGLNVKCIAYERLRYQKPHFYVAADNSIQLINSIISDVPGLRYQAYTLFGKKYGSSQKYNYTSTE